MSSSKICPPDVGHQAKRSRAIFARNKHSLLILITLCLASAGSLLILYFYKNNTQRTPPNDLTSWASPVSRPYVNEVQKSRGGVELIYPPVRSQDLPEEATMTSDLVALALKEPTFGNISFPHLKLGGFINAGS